MFAGIQVYTMLTKIQLRLSYYHFFKKSVMKLEMLVDCGVLEGVSPTESGFKCQNCDEPLPQVFKQKEICASTPKESTTVSLKNNSISSTEAT